mmetsp:Transcript_14873/g.31943  ORF Transcript_14873/g.31943 Transcript_14873/m.31943 type:complete len:220 (-) Transcript_14873:425-1084(-)
MGVEVASFSTDNFPNCGMRSMWSLRSSKDPSVIRSSSGPTHLQQQGSIVTWQTAQSTPYPTSPKSPSKVQISPAHPAQHPPRPSPAQHANVTLQQAFGVHSVQLSQLTLPHEQTPQTGPMHDRQRIGQQDEAEQSGELQSSLPRVHALHTGPQIKPQHSLTQHLGEHSVNLPHVSRWQQVFFGFLGPQNIPHVILLHTMAGQLAHAFAQPMHLPTHSPH